MGNDRTLAALEDEGPGRPLELNVREVVNAIFYIVRTGQSTGNVHMKPLRERTQ